jgi:hypothetical protein
MVVAACVWPGALDDPRGHHHGEVAAAARDQRRVRPD